MITLRLLAAGVSWSAACVNLPVDAVRVEPAGSCGFRREVDDVEHAAGGAAGGNAVPVGGDDIGRAVERDALVIVARPVQAVPGRRDRISLPGQVAVEQRGTDRRRVIRLACHAT